MEFVHTDKAPAAVGPYSQAVKSGSTLYVSGQLGLNPETMTLEQGFEAQATRSLQNLGEILAKAGYAVSDIVAVDVFLTDMGQFKVFNGIYADFMGDHKPARAAIEVAGLPLGGVVEVKCIAVKA